MSALGGKADIAQTSDYVRFRPIADLFSACKIVAVICHWG